MATPLDHVEAADAAHRLATASADESRYFNRDLSSVDFSARVLTVAEDPTVPLLERAKFVAIVSDHIDDLFQIRVAALKDQLAAGLASAGEGPAEQLRAIRTQVEALVARQDQLFLKAIVPELGDKGIVLSSWDELDDDDRAHLDAVFEERIFPVLTPLAVDPGHPFPFISHLSLNLAIIVRDPTTSERRFARVKVPPLLPRFVVMPDMERFVPLEQVIAAHLGALFPGMEIVSHDPFRVTRNADLALEEEEADDLLEAVELELRRRGRPATRLEVQLGTSEEVVELLVRELDLGPEDVYVVESPLDLTGLWSVHDLDRPDLKDEPWVPVTHPRLAGATDTDVDVFAAMRERELLVHHPYDSFATSVGAFIEQAAVDPQVLAIKLTLYRTSGDSPIVEALIRASKQGKEVAALVELKARGDEVANIAWARALEDAGVHVVYGLVGLKTHTKTALVVRAEEDGIRRYCHVGTGNYNPRTARQYEDLGLLSADPALGADLSDLLNYLTGYSRQVRYRRLLVAPVSLRQELLGLIGAETEAGSEGRIVMKMNSLIDHEVIEALYEASSAGVEIDLIVRGICGLRPGVAGMSERIRVRSVIGRFLEHSRIFAFGARDRRSFLIGSADLMPRNLDRRVEALAPVRDPDLQARLQEILDVNLAPDTRGWTLGPDGAWSTVPAGDGTSSQIRFQELATERGRRRRDGATA